MGNTVGLICLKFCLWPILTEGTEYEYSGSEDEDDGINEDEGEPRYVLIHIYENKMTAVYILHILEGGDWLKTKRAW